MEGQLNRAPDCVGSPFARHLPQGPPPRMQTFYCALCGDAVRIPTSRLLQRIERSKSKRLYCSHECEWDSKKKDVAPKPPPEEDWTHLKTIREQRERRKRAELRGEQK